MSSDDYLDPIDETRKLSEQYNQQDSPGGMAWSGIGGFHTVFRHDNGLHHALTTAFHDAIEFGLDELFLDGELIKTEYGELTPKTARTELECQLEEFYGLSPDSWFVQELAGAYEAKLEQLDEALEQNSNEKLGLFSDNGGEE